jgi:hypothetical protein
MGDRTAPLTARRLPKFLAVLMLLVGVTLVPTSAAHGGVVPNIFYCSRWTHRCVQLNGSHVGGIPNECHWVWTYYSSGMSSSGCNIWW